ncbi:MAG TPA: HAD-IA family hydrolase [Patescibacteria group bacterium]|nr:HAD-IA family hydrolase [Patescibacteria group bacterium]
MPKKSSPKVKLILFDAAGMSWSGGYPTTCRYLAKKYRWPYEQVLEVMQNKWFLSACTGQMTSIQAMAGGAKELGIPLSGEQVERMHLRLHKVNRPVLKYANELRKQGYKVVLLSNNFSKYIAQFKKQFQLEKYFDAVINSQDLGFKKQDPRMFQYVLKKYRVRPSEVIFFDDLLPNHAVPQQMGFHCLLFTSLESMKKDLSKWLFKPQLYIFDLHGVLLNGDYHNISRELAKKYQVKAEKIYDTVYGYHKLAAVRKFDQNQVIPQALNDLHIPADAALIRKKHIYYTSRPKKMIFALAKKLREEGNVVIGLSKNIPYLFLANVQRSRLLSYVDDALNSYDLKLPKASRKTMLVIMKKYGFKNPQDIIYIDDQADNLVEPKKMGVKTILYSNYREMLKHLARMK